MLTIQSKILKNTIAPCMGAIPKNNPSHPILACLLLEAKDNIFKITGFDLNIGISFSTEEVQIETEFSTCVPAKLFWDYLNAIDGEVCLKLDDEDGVDELEKSVLSVKSQMGNCNFSCLSSKEFPQLPILDENSEIINIPANILEKAFSVLSAASTQESKQILQGINIKTTSAGDIAYAATDGHRLAVATTDLRGESEADIEFPEINVTIPHTAIRELKVIIAVARETESEIVQLQVNDSQAKFSTDKTVLTSRLLSFDRQSYPQYEQLIPVTFEYEIICERATFVDTLRVLKVMSNKHKEEFTIAKFKIDSQEIEGQVQQNEMGMVTNRSRLELSNIEELEIALNLRYITEAVDAIKGSSLKIQINNPMQPVVVKSTIENLLHLLMPIQIRD